MSSCRDITDLPQHVTSINAITQVTKELRQKYLSINGSASSFGAKYYILQDNSHSMRRVQRPWQTEHPNSLTKRTNLFPFGTVRPRGYQEQAHRSPLTNISVETYLGSPSRWIP